MLTDIFEFHDLNKAKIHFLVYLIAPGQRISSKVPKYVSVLDKNYVYNVKNYEKLYLIFFALFTSNEFLFGNGFRSDPCTEKIVQQFDSKKSITNVT